MPPRPALLLLACLPLAACASGPGRAGRVESLMGEGRFDLAVARAAELHEADPENAELRRQHRRASVAWYLDEGRQAMFADRDEQALGHFREALRIAPQNEVVRDWVLKAQRKLADRWVERALDLEGQGELRAATDAYDRALEYVPDDPQAIAGAARILVIQNYRRGLGEDYYQDGVRRLREALLLQASQHFAYTTKYLPDYGRAEDREKQVRRQLAGERLQVARHFEDQGLFPAAATEYRIVLLLDPGNPEAEEGLERAKQEGRALARLEEADMLVRKNRLDEASAVLEQGLELTEAQVERFERQRIDIEENALLKLYEHALDLESDYDYPEAIGVYERILAEARYFEDAIARKETLEDYVALAEKLYARLLEAETDEERLDLLLQLEVFWPEYRDVPERLRELEPERR